MKCNCSTRADRGRDPTALARASDLLRTVLTPAPGGLPSQGSRAADPRIPSIMSRRILRLSGLVLALGASAALLAFVQTASRGGAGASPPPAAAQDPAAACPAGQTEVRPGSCRAPELPPPSIVDYRPRSTLVSEEHLVPRARFPVVDVHGHARDLAAPGTHRGDGGGARRAEPPGLRGRRQPLRRPARAGGGGDPRERLPRTASGCSRASTSTTWAPAGASAPCASSRRTSPRARSAWARSRRASASPSGSPTARACAWTTPSWTPSGRRSRATGVPAFIHTAEPPEFFQPLDYENERWLELALFPNRRNQDVRLLRAS